MSTQDFLVYVLSSSTWQNSSCYSRFVLQPYRCKFIKLPWKSPYYLHKFFILPIMIKPKFRAPLFLQVPHLTLLTLYSLTNLIARRSGRSLVTFYEVTMPCLLPKFRISYFANAFHFSPTLLLLRITSLSLIISPFTSGLISPYNEVMHICLSHQVVSLKMR